MKNIKFHYSPIPASKTQWLENRQSGIGGSEVGAILGLNPYESSIEVFRRKIGMLPLEQEDSMPMFMGRFLEDKIAELWQYSHLFEDEIPANFEAGNKKKFYEKFKYTIRNRNYPHLLANIDGLILPKGVYMHESNYGVLEVKNMASWVSKQWEDGIPAYYKAQIQTYLTITELEYGEIASLIDGRRITSYEFERDEQMIEEIERKTYDFWELVVRARRILANKNLPESEAIGMIEELEPKPDSSEAWAKYLQSAYKVKKDAPSMIGTDELMSLAIGYQNANESLKKMEEQKRFYSNKIKAIMGENEQAYFAGNGNIAWKEDARGTRSLRMNLKHFELV